MDNKEITEFLLQSKENTYANVKGLFDTQIFDYLGSLNNTGMTDASAYIRFDVTENERIKCIKTDNYYVYIAIDIHNALMHTNGNVNNLDMIADKVVEDIKKTFGERISRIDNTFGKCEDNQYFQERVISFALEK